MKQVELLAPAGNYEALEGAICAGADAVYLAGNHFGARAYADNFTEEELCCGIRMAHIYGKRIYLTVNILVKEAELPELVAFLQPLYEAGLDGVIVQDLGVIRVIRRYFPNLPVHASTQMTITGSDGARFLKEQGICRVVPARELSLKEIRRIRKETGIEVETFIHGAMCYCYSGQCLFSSILGGRSGNRGRCAQPCRLPYTMKNQKECYPLSMKDMCTIELLPELIEAGIDSFKIEGRMKKPAYAAGVTSIYRKYIDLYYSGKPYQVEKDDQEFLSSLYIRSEVGEGYYHQKNGRNMITLSSPAYSKTSDQVLKTIEDRYLKQKKKIEIDAVISLKKGEPCFLLLTDGNVQASVLGSLPQEALKQPIREEDIRKQMNKLGNTAFILRDLQILMDEEVFVPIRELNDLRRKAVFYLEEERIRENGLPGLRHMEESPACFALMEQSSRQNAHGESQVKTPEMLDIFISTKEQYRALCAEGSKKNGQDFPIRRIYLDYSLLAEKDLLSSSWEEWKGKLFLAGSYVIREHNRKDLKVMEKALRSERFEGLLFRNLETYAYMKEVLPESRLIPDHNLYFWNHETVQFWKNRVTEYTLPVEENQTEWKELLAKAPKHMEASALVYGRLPMMVTANCIEKTMRSCQHEAGISVLTDRYKTSFPVLHNCQSCYNIIYNSVPLSLHTLVVKNTHGISAYRLDFTTENGEEMMAVIRYFADLLSGVSVKPPYQEYTTGHIKRGVE